MADGPGSPPGSLRPGYPVRTERLLLRPLAIRRHGRDFEVKLRGSAVLNPAFAAARAGTLV